MDFNGITSFIAGGQFEPSQIWHEYNTSGTKPVLDDYLRRSAQRIRELRGKWGDYGIVVRGNYALDNDYPSFDEHTPHDVVPPFVRGRLPFARLDVVGREYQTWLLNPRIMLPRLKADLMRSSVQFTTKEFSDRGEVERLPENIVVNCTGYGAKQLFTDDDLKPRRGHIALLRNPANLKYLFSGGCSNHVISYLFARQNDIIVGGTVQDDDRDYLDTNDPEDSLVCNRIMDNIVKVFDDQSDSCIDPLGMV